MAYDIRSFLETKTASAGNFSADGSKLLVHSNLTGTMQLYVVPSGGGEMRALTNFTEPVGGMYLPATDDVLLAMDEGGNERTQLSLVRDDGSDVRPLVRDPQHIHRPGGVTRDGRTIAYASNRRNGTDFDVYVRDLVTGEDRCVFGMGGWCNGAGFSPDGTLLAVVRLTERNADNDVYLVNVSTGDVLHVTPHDDEAAFGAPRWAADGEAFYFSTDHEHEFSRIARYELRDRAWKPVIERGWDLTCDIDWPGRTLAVTANEDGYSRIELFDATTLTSRGLVPLPGRGLASPGFSKDGRYIAYTFVSPREPGDAWLYELDGGRTTRLTNVAKPVPPDEMVEPELHRVDSFDGERFPVFLYRPASAPDDAPVVVMIHGGPESQYVPSFNPVIQYLVSRGYAVAAPNVRGSTGYGKRFHHLDDGRRRLDSVRDLESLHAWLRSTGGVDASRAALMGGSYGGYMVLAGLAFQPQLWAAGVDVVGISSLVTFLENTAPWRRAFREREYGRLDTDREFLVEASPLTHVDRIRAPLAIVHGANDPRVPLGEAEQIHAALRAKGVPTELLVYYDEGHGLAKLKNRLDAYPKVTDFLDRVLR